MRHGPWGMSMVRFDIFPSGLACNIVGWNCLHVYCLLNLGRASVIYSNPHPLWQTRSYKNEFGASPKQFRNDLRELHWRQRRLQCPWVKGVWINLTITTLKTIPSHDKGQGIDMFLNSSPDEDLQPHIKCFAELWDALESVGPSASNLSKHCLDPDQLFDKVNVFTEIHTFSKLVGSYY